MANSALQQQERKRRSKSHSTDAPSLEWAYKALAKLGGFTDTKRTGIAGWETLWRGWELLQEYVNGFLLTREMLANSVDLDEI